MAHTAQSIDHKVRYQNEVIAQILQMLAEIKFGSIEITIHDSKITQIERKEKVRPMLEK